MGSRPRIAVIGHVEHITAGRVERLPAVGDIVHLDAPRAFPGGGGGVTFSQLVKSPAEVLLFTAFGDDDAGTFVERAVCSTGARVFAARRGGPHTRDVVLVTPDGERTIVVVGEPLHPRLDDPLPWGELERCDAVYFTAQDPALLTAARRARTLVVTARRRPALLRSGVRADVVVGSAKDPRELTSLADYPVRPGALVMTEGREGGRVETDEGVRRFASVPVEHIPGGAYGAGDSFAGAMTYFLAQGLEVLDAAARAAPFGAAILRATDPLEGQLPITEPR